ncbi:MAG: hypothetical protein ABIR81_00480, partial [Ginsengibacter sp.]
KTFASEPIAIFKGWLFLFSQSLLIFAIYLSQIRSLSKITSVTERKPIKDILAEAKTAEGEAQPINAVTLYEQALKQDTLNEQAYGRLMVIYRKQKDSQKELAIINTALAAYKQFYKTQQRTTKTITTLSNKLNKAFGLTDKKGNSVYLPEPLATCEKGKICCLRRKRKKRFKMLRNGEHLVIHNAC